MSEENQKPSKEYFQVDTLDEWQSTFDEYRTQKWDIIHVSTMKSERHAIFEKDGNKHQLTYRNEKTVL